MAARLDSQANLDHELGIGEWGIIRERSFISAKPGRPQQTVSLGKLLRLFGFYEVGTSSFF
jgi:hypothetical protein